MSKYENDPLVEYIEKHAKQMEDNIHAFAQQQLDAPEQAVDSDFTDTPADKKRKEDDELLRKLFTNYPGDKVAK